MTNADCIRRMNDEQLYEFLSEWECGDIDYSVTFCALCNEATKRGEVGNVLNLDCDGCRKHWLQRDAVDFGGLMYWKKNTTFDTTADRKTEPTTEDCSTVPTISKMEQVDEPHIVGKHADAIIIDESRLMAKCLNCANGGSYKCSKCDGEMYFSKMYFKEEPKDEPQTERSE